MLKRQGESKNKKDGKIMHDKKNLLKLLPAAAVIAAVAVTAVQGKATDGIQKEPENTEVRGCRRTVRIVENSIF